MAQLIKRGVSEDFTQRITDVVDIKIYDMNCDSPEGAADDELSYWVDD